jgi:hypothetical protein
MIRDTFSPALFSVISSKCSFYKKLKNLTKSYLSRPKVGKFTTMTVLHFDCQYLLILWSNPTKPTGYNHSVVILPNCGKKLCQKMPVVRVTENVRAVQSSYYSSCPCPTKQARAILRKFCLSFAYFLPKFFPNYHACNILPNFGLNSSPISVYPSRETIILRAFCGRI